MRIAKAMARAGLCSRREAERWIADGRRQRQRLQGAEDAGLRGGSQRLACWWTACRCLSPRPAQLWRYYEPKGLVTTHSDPQGRPTVFDNLPPGLPRVVSVGRLDFNTEGLILLTNDGELARHLELPATGWLRRYRVRAKGRATQADFDKLKEGVEIEGVKYGPVEAAVDTVQGANMWITIGIREGKNREVRKVLSSLGLEVNRLIRISFGPFQLLEMEPGETEIVRRRVLADQLGPQLCRRVRASSIRMKSAIPKAGAGSRAQSRRGSRAREQTRTRHESGRRQVPRSRASPRLSTRACGPRPTACGNRSSIFWRMGSRVSASRSRASSIFLPEPARSASRRCRAGRNTVCSWRMGSRRRRSSAPMWKRWGSRARRASSGAMPRTWVPSGPWRRYQIGFSRSAVW